MNFQCKNCGGNMVFEPKSGKMFCQYCKSFDSETKTGDRSVTVCASCGGEISIDTNVSSSQCPYCGNFLVFDERLENNLEPKEILPFSITKEMAEETLKKVFKKRTFAPVGFFGKESFKNLKGDYVPFFLYDYNTVTEFDGTGTKSRSWISGDKEYTETSYYHLIRKMRAGFSKVPADASYFDDQKMDTLEPFPYDRLKQFDPKYMSGFYGYIFDAPASSYEPRVKGRISGAVSRLLSESYAEFNGVRADVNETDFGLAKSEYVLMPVWEYEYQYKDRTYLCYVNGVTGKAVGEVPVSKKKVVGYSLFFGTVVWLLIQAGMLILEVLA
ncbi:MAG: hypothetical protein K6E32_03005 [Lachnospiraceae bacterium]|nr:hypothetical protein [Lachnospiraceae bacterium]